MLPCAATVEVSSSNPRKPGKMDIAQKNQSAHTSGTLRSANAGDRAA